MNPSQRNNIVVNLISFIYIFYSLQGVLYSSGSFISKTLMLIYLAFGLVHLLLVFLRTKCNLPIIMAGLFVALNILYYIFYDGKATSIAYQHIKGVLACFTPFFIGYYYSYKREFSESIFKYLLPSIFIAYLLSFYRMYDILLEQVNTSDKIVNNISYSFTRIIPLLLYFNTKTIISVLFLLLINFFIITGAKRGAAVSAILADLGYIVYIMRQGRNSNILYKSAIFIVLISFAIGMWHLLSSNTFLVDRFLEGGVSQRDYIYLSIWDWWTAYDIKIYNFLFGGGIVNSVSISGGFLAHNDWLEVISNFGILGLIIYLILLVSLTTNILSLKTSREKYAGSIIVLMWWVTSLTSTWYNTSDNFPAMLLLGFLIGQKYSYKQIIN